MRTKLSAVLGVLALATTTGVLLAATHSASALKCPNGTVPWTIPAGPTSVGACKPAPYPPCDPGPCDPTAIAPQN